MKAQFFDRQDTNNPSNGTDVEDLSQLRTALEDIHERPPFFAELIGENGFKLTLGIGVGGGCAQFSPADGSPPYLMAVGDTAEGSQEEVIFLIGGTASPVPMRYCLPYEDVLQIAGAFLRTGQRKADVCWEEI